MEETTLQVEERFSLTGGLGNCMNKNVGRGVIQLVNDRRGERLKFKMDKMGSRTNTVFFYIPLPLHRRKGLRMGCPWSRHRSSESYYLLTF